MPRFSQQSLEQLRQKVDLVDLISQYVDLKKAGSVYKGLCPFHEEKTPSFTIQAGQHYFYCFGCHVHGDAIGFLMHYLHLPFSEAVRSLAERAQITLETETKEREGEGQQIAAMRHCLQEAHLIFRNFLEHSTEGKVALEYLFQRGVDWEFIDRFELGLAPSGGSKLVTMMQSLGHEQEILERCGLGTRHGRRTIDFFRDRITFPIKNATGSIVGFSARKFREETTGGKYVNSPDHPLFKKSNLLYGLSESRRRIAKERRAIIVEGQIDALRLILEGFDYTVASQGTAFGQHQLKLLLDLKVEEIFLAFDPDLAGQKAAQQLGDLFQREGVEVYLVPLPPKHDPDLFVRSKGPSAFQRLLDEKRDYLTFLVDCARQEHTLGSPALKVQLFERIAQQVQGWNHRLMIEESLKKLAQLLEISTSHLKVPKILQTQHPEKKKEENKLTDTLEIEMLRCLLSYPFLETLGRLRSFLQPEYFFQPHCRRLFEAWQRLYDRGAPHDLLLLAAALEEETEEDLLNELAKRTLSKKPSSEHVREAVQRLTDRHWLLEKQNLHQEIANTTDEETRWTLLKTFANLKQAPTIPTIE